MHNKNINYYGVQDNGAMSIFPALYKTVPYKPLSMNFLSIPPLVYYYHNKSAIDSNKSAIISNKHKQTFFNHNHNITLQYME